MGIWHHP
jgi:hypothetical protein